MKHYLIALAWGLCITCLAASGALAGGLGLYKVGVGGYGVSHIPIQQDDAEKGPLFGIKGKVSVAKLLAFEASVNFINSGDAEHDLDPGGTVKFAGPEVTSTAFNINFGGAFYSTAGVGVSKVDLQEGGGSSTETTYNFGTGLEIGFGKLSIDGGVRLFVIKNGDDGSRKNLLIIVGANYYIF